MAKTKKTVKKGLKKARVTKVKPRKTARPVTLYLDKLLAAKELDTAAIGQQRADFGRNKGKLLTVSAIVIDFDGVDINNKDESPADKTMILKVRNQPPKKDSKEQKPSGQGWPTGQVESLEEVAYALRREVSGETGHRIMRIVDLIRVYKKTIKDVNDQPKENLIFLYLAEVDGYNGKVVERDEIDASMEPWMSLREVFTTPFAQDRQFRNRNPYGLYFSHVKRLLDTLRYLLITPEDELPETLASWLKEDRHDEILRRAMEDMRNDGTLERFYRRAYPGEEVRQEFMPD